MNKKKIIGISLSIFGIILIAIGFMIFNIYIKKEGPANGDINDNKVESSNNNSEEKSSYRCYQNEQNIEFATVESYYEFDYQYEIINNQKQVYIFKFINNDLYNQFGLSELFPDQTSTPEEITDLKNLTKTYYIYAAIPYSEEQVNVDEYIKIVESYGYQCSESK